MMAKMEIDAASIKLTLIRSERCVGTNYYIAIISYIALLTTINNRTSTNKVLQLLLTFPLYIPTL